MLKAGKLNSQGYRIKNPHLMPKTRLFVRIQSRISVPSSSLFSSSSSPLSSTLPPILASLHQPVMLQKVKSLKIIK